MSSRPRNASLWLVLATAAVMPMACGEKPSSGPTAATSASASTPEPAAKPRGPLKAPERSGGALMRSADGMRLYLADEDHATVRVLPLPFGEVPKPPPLAAAASASAAASAAAAASATASAAASASAAPVKQPPPGTIPPIPPPPSATQKEFVVPGPPAQVLPIDGYVLVTIRNPGLLLVLKEKPDNGLEEAARIPLAADAWGVAVTPDEKTAIVTSAWTHTVTGVDLGEKKVLWTLDVAREPRGAVVHPDGKRAYISHLTSGDLTRIDDVTQASAKSSTVAFPAAPQRAPSGVKSTASLGYVLALDDAGNRLFAARHALSAIGAANWFGSPTVDVLQTENDKPLLGPRVPDKLLKTTPAFDEAKQSVLEMLGDRDPSDYRLRLFKSPVLSDTRLSQPRALVVAHKTQTAWIASEAMDLVAEIPLRAAAPIEGAQRYVMVGSHYKDQKIIASYDEGGIPGHCGAPTGLALSEDETKLYVFCRSTYDVATVLLTEKNPPVVVARVAEDPLGEDGSRGRRLFYGGRDRESTDDLGCAGCHPEGRDDGHVWHDIYDFPEDKSRRPVFFASHMIAAKTKGGKLGYPRQTPMLAGRVNSSGPYGWHAQSETLLDRLAEGFSKHRWWGTEPAPKSWMTGERANALRVFLRKGLPTPPRLERALTEEELRGKKLFESDDTQCAKCHVPNTEFTDRAAYELPKIAPPPGFEEESDGKFKTPSLFFVVGSAPYYHDGHAPTLEALIAQNNDRMGKTNQLSAADKAALVAYLKTL